MPHQICTDCGKDFAGEDDDGVCDECAIEKIEECAQNTGHQDTETLGDGKVCRGCGVLVP